VAAILTSAALVKKGTPPQQRVMIGTLTTLPKLIKNQDAPAPTLLITDGVSVYNIDYSDIFSPTLVKRESIHQVVIFVAEFTTELFLSN
jgi:siroheme synthase